MLTRTEVNVSTGERKEVELTQDEINAALAATAAEALALQEPKAPTLADVISVLPQECRDALTAKLQNVAAAPADLVRG